MTDIKMVEVSADSIEAMADNIALLSRAAKKLSERYEKRAVVALLREYCNVNKDNIWNVLTALESMDGKIKKPPKKKVA